ncbi:hypothetical protein BGZ74_003864, partial [Mortierella antarctica]
MRQHQVIWWLSSTGMFTAYAALIARAVQLGASSPDTQFGTLTLLIAWASAMVLNHLEHRQDVRSSTYIYGFYVMTLAASAIHIRTLHDLGLTNQAQFTSFCVFFGALIIGFVVEAWPRSATVREQDTLDRNRPTAYDQANLVSRLCFHFVQSVISKGYRQPLVDDDVANMMPKRIRTVHSHNLVSQEWDCQLASCEPRSNNKKPSLLWAVLKAGGWSWLPIFVFALFESIMEYVQPLLLDVLLNFISSYSTDDPSPPEYGVILSIGMFVAALLASIASGQYFQMCTNLGLEFKAGLVSMIYRKSLKLSPSARRETTVGEISNHMSVDAEMISQTMSFIPGIISAPFEICVGMWLLYRQLGASAFTGLGLVLLIIPIQGPIARKLNMAKDKKLEAMDNRVRLMNEILSSIKIVKLYAWPIGRMSQIVSHIISLNVAARRIESFLLQEQLDDAQIEYFDSPQGSSVGDFIRVKSASDMTLSQPGSKVMSISVHNATFSWDRATGEPEKVSTTNENSLDGSTPTLDQGGGPALVDINLQIPSGSLSILMGRVGQGKSSLLGAIIGDIYKHKGRVCVYGQLAYVPQQAWIINASLKENIF